MSYLSNSKQGQGSLENLLEQGLGVTPQNVNEASSALMQRNEVTRALFCYKRFPYQTKQDLEVDLVGAANNLFSGVSFLILISAGMSCLFIFIDWMIRLKSWTAGVTFVLSVVLTALRFHQWDLAYSNNTRSLCTRPLLLGHLLGLLLLVWMVFAATTQFPADGERVIDSINPTQAALMLGVLVFTILPMIYIATVTIDMDAAEVRVVRFLCTGPCFIGGTQIYSIPLDFYLQTPLTSRE